MGIGPVPAIRKVLELTGLKKEDVDVWEASIGTKTNSCTFLILHVQINEAFASQFAYCVEQLDIPIEKINIK